MTYPPEGKSDESSILVAYFRSRFRLIITMPAQNSQLEITLTDSYPRGKIHLMARRGWVDCLDFIRALGMDDIDLEDVYTYAGIQSVKALVTYSDKRQSLLTGARR
jgi:hypothetical protein